MGLPPQMPSMSEPMLGLPERLWPMNVGTWKRMYSQLPPVWSPVHTPAKRWLPAQPSRVTMLGRIPESPSLVVTIS